MINVVYHHKFARGGCEEKSAALANIDWQYCIIAKWEIWRAQMMLMLPARNSEPCFYFVFIKHWALRIQCRHSWVARTAQPHLQRKRSWIGIPRSGNWLGWRKRKTSWLNDDVMTPSSIIVISLLCLPLTFLAANQPWTGECNLLVNP